MKKMNSAEKEYLSDTKKRLPTFEERFEMAARSETASLLAAVKMVERIPEIRMTKFLARSADLEAMERLTGEFSGYLDDKELRYRDFCRSLQLMTAGSGAPAPDSLADASGQCRPAFGTRVNNALILHGLILLDHANGKIRHKDVCRCMRMTLGQYLDALENYTFREDRASIPWREEIFRSWKNDFLKGYDASRPLAETLAEIIKRYTAGWQEFDHVDYILRCMGALSCYLEENMSGKALPKEKADTVRRFRESLCRFGPDLEGWELIEADKRYLDPEGYYFALAYEYPEYMPDPGGRELKAGAVRSQIFLADRDYSLKTLRELKKNSPSTILGELLEKSIFGNRLSLAMNEINMAVTDLLMLFVEPYLET